MKDERPHVLWSPSAEDRAGLRLRADDASQFVGGDPAGGKEEPAVWPLNGETYILVPPGAPDRPWQDHTQRIGSCVMHHDVASDVSLGEEPCPFRATSFLMSTKPDHLHIALYLDLIAARPDLPRGLVWESVRLWKPVRIKLTGVRVAFMTGREAAERFLPGGEPMLRHSEAAWGYVRWAHTHGNAALVVVESDPAGARVAARLLFFCSAAEALCDAGALEVAPLDCSPRRWPRLSERGLDGRLLLPRVLIPAGEKRSVTTRYYERATRAWASLRRGARAKRDLWKSRRAVALEIMKREFALDEPDPDRRFRTRVQLIMTFKLLMHAASPRRRRMAVALTLVVAAGHVLLKVT